MKTYKEDHKLMSLLKITEISRVICDTNMGTLKLRIRKGETAYRFVLDSVEVDKDTNKELFELIYPKDYSQRIELSGDTHVNLTSIKTDVPKKITKKNGKTK